MKKILKLKTKNEIKAEFSFRQGELWYFRLNEFETRSIGQDEIEYYNGKKPEDYPHFSDDYTAEPTFYDANAPLANNRKPKSRRGIWYSKPAVLSQGRKGFTVACCETLSDSKPKTKICPNFGRSLRSVKTLWTW